LEATINELNAITNMEIIEAINKLRTPKHFVRKDKGNKLKTRVILTTIDDSQSLETTALLDSGCTRSTLNICSVRQHNLPTRQLPRSIRVYNADGTLNSNGAITETCKLHMTFQDHIEEVNFAVSDIGNSDVYIGHDWLKQHNPTVNWTNSRILMSQCPHTCHFISDVDINEDEPTIDTTSSPRRRRLSLHLQH
jgi:hypothetical protein